MFDIIVGRNKHDQKKMGKNGLILLGKQYIKMGRTTSLSNNVYLDIASSHVTFICGKRGGGKSYTMGAIAEGFSMLEEGVKKRLSVIMLDTMGIYWTMKYPNKQDEELLTQWGITPAAVDIKIFTPEKYYYEFKKKKIPTDVPFSLNAMQLDQDDWCLAFKQDKYSPIGVLITRIILELKKLGNNYTLDDIMNRIRNDSRSEGQTKDATESMFLMA